MSRRRAALLGAGAALVIFLLADAFVEPPAHDVHSPGGTPAKVTFFESNSTVAWVPSQPSQSLADMQCRLITGAAKCDASTLTCYLLDLAALRRRVGRWRGHYVAGLQHRLRSLDQEARNPRYRAKPWLYTPEYVYGLVALPRYLLAAVSTSEMTAGAITIIEDDHLEHLVGDQTDEYQLATATIS